ncbi:MAG: hypothetical protein ACE37B_06465 [Ilumatobacter sp.]|jgi:hypothetical protein|uniref:hypothetical protein n=1 Tax=Ilumatobacter sp. TaxID=1967498 RepID=UPI00391B9972
MWTIITIISVVAAIIVIGIRLVAARPSEHDPHEQPTTVDPDTAEFPDPGSHLSPQRPDGSPVPGSEADRNRHGKP